MRAWLFIAIAFFAAPAWCARAANVTIPKAKLDAYFDALETNGLVNGAIAISQRGEPRYQRFLGFAETGATGSSPTDAGTRYRIGAVSKLFTAVLVMQLVESASIGLDSRLAEFFPELPNALDITYRDLLQQRSGLSSYVESPDRAALLASIAALSPPRERVEYSGTDYLLLSLIAEKVYEKPFADVLRRQVAEKLGLARTYYPTSPQRSTLESISYAFVDGRWTPDAPPDADLTLGAGGMVSSPADLVRFIDALFAGRLVTAQSLATMRGNADTPGAGLIAADAAGRAGFGASGHVDHTATWVWHSPETGISIAFATNAARLSIKEMADEVLALLFERGRKPPTAETLKPAG